MSSTMATSCCSASTCDARRATDAVTIETARFTLRPLVRGDARALFGTLSDEAQCRYLSRSAFASEEELADWLTDPDWNGRSWVAVDRDSGTVAGRYIVVPARDPAALEVGYITVRSWQGRGVARECMAALIDHLFAHEDVRRFVAEVDAENLASAAVARRLGFREEGCLREHEITHKGLCDLMIFGLLRREWATRRA